MKLKRVPLNDGDPFTSAAMVIDDELSAPKTVAVVLFSSGGNVIYLHNEEYAHSMEKIEMIMAAAEEYFGESVRAQRFKVFLCEPVEAMP